MRRLRFKKIDAFAQGRARGNPAGAVYLEPDDKIEASQMLRLAREFAGFVTKVAFVQQVQAGDIDFRLTYYSAEREVDFCGHATIAVTYDLIRSDPTHPLALVNAGLNTLIVPVTGYEACLGVSPDLKDLRKVCLPQGGYRCAIHS